jgi:hypothetical protein
VKAACLSVMFLLGLACNAGATSLEDLLQADELRMRTWLEPADNIVVSQEVKLIIEISTRRWFAGGTRIRHPEVRDLVILQRDQFATNLSRQENGQTWVIQQWTLELYPQREGSYQVPPLKLELAVNHATAGIVRGSLVTTALEFSATVPTLLRGDNSWLATPLLEITQEFDRELRHLQAGDAFTRTISIRATHLTAMMLPVPLHQSPQGLSAYPANPVLRDRSNRGEATAERIETITYVVEKSGQYQLPPQEFYWWDTLAQQPRIAALPPIDIDAGVAVAEAENSGKEFNIHISLRWLLIPLAVLLILLLRKYRRRRPVPARALLSAANRALRKGEISEGMKLLYAWLNRGRSSPDWLSLRDSSQACDDQVLVDQVDELLSAAYGAGGDQPQQVDLRKLERKSASRRWRRFLPAPTRLQLNPESSAARQKACD